MGKKGICPAPPSWLQSSLGFVGSQKPVLQRMGVGLAHESGEHVMGKCHRQCMWGLERRRISDSSTNSTLQNSTIRHLGTKATNAYNVHPMNGDLSEFGPEIPLWRTRETLASITSGGGKPQKRVSQLLRMKADLTQRGDAMASLAIRSDARHEGQLLSSHPYTAKQGGLRRIARKEKHLLRREGQRTKKEEPRLKEACQCTFRDTTAKHTSEWHLPWMEHPEGPLTTIAHSHGRQGAQGHTQHPERASPGSSYLSYSLHCQETPMGTLELQHTETVPCHSQPALTPIPCCPRTSHEPLSPAWATLTCLPAHALVALPTTLLTVAQ